MEPRESRGVFVAFEGGDGAGKSTQVALLRAGLEKSGRSVVVTREPGGTPIGEKLRSLVLEFHGAEVDARTEALIFAAARAAHVEQFIAPHLAAGDCVITDRYEDSSIAYQGTGRELGSGAIAELNDWATGGLVPDLTVLLDVDPAVARERRRSGRDSEDRMESEADEFHARIRTAFVDRAAEEPGRYLVLDAARPAQELAVAIRDRVDRLIGSTVADRGLLDSSLPDPSGSDPSGSDPSDRVAP